MKTFGGGQADVVVKYGNENSRVQIPPPPIFFPLASTSMGTANLQKFSTLNEVKRLLSLLP